MEKLDDQNLEKIFGGRTTRYRSARCGRCDCRGENPVYVGHLCNDCLVKMKETLSPAEFRDQNKIKYSGGIVMKDFKENDRLENLDEKNEEKVSGGYYSYGSFPDGPYCDNCYGLGGIPLKNGSHLCISCLEKLKDTLSPDLFDKYVGS